MKQNQFGFTLGAPTKKDQVLVFGPHPGTRQRNGLDPSCSSSATAMPPLTDDRSPEALGAIFAGQRGFFQEAFGGLGPAVLPDGSNIHPVALALLQFKLHDGSFLIPSPQQIDPATGLGFSAFSIPYIFDADQFMLNLDLIHTDTSTFSSRFFFDDGTEDISLPPSFAPTVPGSPVLRTSRFWNGSLGHKYVFNPNLLNEFELGFHRIALLTEQRVPFSFSDVGARVPSFENDHPVIALFGAFDLGGNGQTVGIIQNTFVLQDSIFTLGGHHNLRLGAGITRIQNNIVKFNSIGAVAFLSFPDSLLGLDRMSNTTFFSNIVASIDTFGLFDRAFRALDANLFVQDDIRVTSRLTFNLGLRYERIGQFGDELGRNAGFNPGLADSTPPVGWGLAGFIVSANFPEAVPDGVTQLDNHFGIDGEGQNNWAPRIGFAWRLPGTDRLVLRGGYGIFLSRPTGQPFVQSLGTPPFGDIRQLIGPLNGAASFDNPFPPAPPIPNFPLLTRTGSETFRSLAPDYRPSIAQNYSLNLQMELARDILLEIGYAGSRGTKLFRTLTFNQALLAGPSNPIRGTTTNTVRNIQQRVPFQGIAANGLNLVQSAGESWYNGLEVSLNERISRGLQFLASSTFSQAINSEGPSIATSAAGLGFAPGDQDNPDARRGRAFFNRRYRFILSYLYELPGPRNRLSLLGGFLGGWSVAGVTTFQSGQPLTILATNSANVFGLSGPQQDRAQLASGCTHNDLVNPGSVSDKLNTFFNTTCFTSAPVIGDDGIATGFGNGGAGIVEGPGQHNFDLVIIKHTPVCWPTDVSNVEFRAEFFSAFNTPQLANPEIQSGLDVTLSSWPDFVHLSRSPNHPVYSQV